MIIETGNNKTSENIGAGLKNDVLKSPRKIQPIPEKHEYPLARINAVLGRTADLLTEQSSEKEKNNALFEAMRKLAEQISAKNKIETHIDRGYFDSISLNEKLPWFADLEKQSVTLDIKSLIEQCNQYSPIKDMDVAQALLAMQDKPIKVLKASVKEFDRRLYKTKQAFSAFQKEQLATIEQLKEKHPNLSTVAIKGEKLALEEIEQSISGSENASELNLARHKLRKFIFGCTEDIAKDIENLQGSDYTLVLKDYSKGSHADFYNQMEQAIAAKRDGILKQWENAKEFLDEAVWEKCKRLIEAKETSKDLDACVNEKLTFTLIGRITQLAELTNDKILPGSGKEKYNEKPESYQSKTYLELCELLASRHEEAEKIGFNFDAKVKSLTAHANRVVELDSYKGFVDAGSVNDEKTKSIDIEMERILTALSKCNSVEGLEEITRQFLEAHFKPYADYKSAFKGGNEAILEDDTFKVQVEAVANAKTPTAVLENLGKLSAAIHKEIDANNKIRYQYDKTFPRPTVKSSYNALKDSREDLEKAKAIFAEKKAKEEEAYKALKKAGIVPEVYEINFAGLQTPSELEDAIQNCMKDNNFETQLKDLQPAKSQSTFDFKALESFKRSLEGAKELFIYIIDKQEIFYKKLKEAGIVSEAYEIKFEELNTLSKLEAATQECIKKERLKEKLAGTDELKAKIKEYYGYDHGADRAAKETENSFADLAFKFNLKKERECLVAKMDLYASCAPKSYKGGLKEWEADFESYKSRLNLEPNARNLERLAGLFSKNTKINSMLTDLAKWYRWRDKHPNGQTTEGIDGLVKELLGQLEQKLDDSQLDVLQNKINNTFVTVHCENFDNFENKSISERVKAMNKAFPAKILDGWLENKSNAPVSNWLIRTNIVIGQFIAKWTNPEQSETPSLFSQTLQVLNAVLYSALRLPAILADKLVGSLGKKTDAGDSRKDLKKSTSTYAHLIPGIKKDSAELSEENIKDKSDKNELGGTEPEMFVEQNTSQSQNVGTPSLSPKDSEADRLDEETENLLSPK